MLIQAELTVAADANQTFNAPLQIKSFPLAKEWDASVKKIMEVLQQSTTARCLLSRCAARLFLTAVKPLILLQLQIHRSTLTCYQHRMQFSVIRFSSEKDWADTLQFHSTQLSKEASSRLTFHLHCTCIDVTSWAFLASVSSVLGTATTATYSNLSHHLLISKCIYLPKHWWAETYESFFSD